jgi:hypothetical protein
MVYEAQLAILMDDDSDDTSCWLSPQRHRGDCGRILNCAIRAILGLARAAQPKRLDPRDQRSQRDSQELGRIGLVARRLLERLHDALPLGVRGRRKGSWISYAPRERQDAASRFDLACLAGRA